MKKKLLSILMLALEIVKVEIVGVKASPIIEPIHPKTTVYPTITLTRDEWALELNVSSKAPKRLVISKEQIAEKFGISGLFEVVIA